MNIGKCQSTQKTEGKLLSARVHNCEPDKRPISRGTLICTLSMSKGSAQAPNFTTMLASWYYKQMLAQLALSKMVMLSHTPAKHTAVVQCHW